MVAFRPNVSNGEAEQYNVVCGSVVRPTIVDVNAISTRIRQNQVVQFDECWISKVKAGIVSLEDWWFRIFGRRQNDWHTFLTLQSVEV